jgi:hypothetical protein
MVEKLKSVLKTPKLRSGAKALVLALSLYALPLWVTGALAFLFYFWPVTFSLGFMGTFISLSIVSAVLFGAAPSFITALAAGVVFFLLLGIKNVLFLHRFSLFLLCLGFIVFSSVWGFFSGLVSLPVLAVMIFLAVRDGLAAFTPFPKKASLFAAVSALVVSEMSWAVFYLNIPDHWATVSVILVFIGVIFMTIEYLRGHLFKSEAPFWATALAVVAFAIAIIASF